MCTILVIEDNVSIRENTAELLTLHHYTVLAAEDGVEGWLLTKKHTPDLVLCDVMMPVSGGPTFLKKLREDKRLKKTPVIFFTAFTPTSLPDDKTKDTADGFLQKPFQEEDLLTIITDVCANNKLIHTNVSGKKKIGPAIHEKLKR